MSTEKGGPPLTTSAREREVFLPEERHPHQLTWQQKLASKLSSRNIYVREFLAEFLGTFVLVGFGLGTVAQFVFGSAEKDVHFNVVSLQLGWGLAVAMGVYVAGGASGAHLNPAVTLCFALFGRLPVRKVPIYLIAQYIGAFLGAFLVFLVYQDKLYACDGGLRQGPYTLPPLFNNCSTAGIFSTYPAANVSTWQGFVDQIVGTGLLMLMVLAITDERNMQVPKGLVPIAIGLTIVVILTAFETNCGAALNPARDLGPRIFTAIAGWGGGVFSFRDYNWFWVPVLGPHVGAILGGWLYNICVGLHWPPVNDSSFRLK